MIEGKITSLLFSGNPNGNGANHARSLDAARTKQTPAKLKKGAGRTTPELLSAKIMLAGTRPKIIPADLRRIEAKLRPLRAVNDLPSASLAKQNLDTATTGPFHTSSTMGLKRRGPEAHAAEMTHFAFSTTATRPRARPTLLSPFASGRPSTPDTAHTTRSARSSRCVQQSQAAIPSAPLGGLHEHASDRAKRCFPEGSPSPVTGGAA